MLPSSKDTQKMVTGALIAGAGAALYYTIDWASGFDFGQWGPAISAALSVLVNVVRKLRDANSRW